MSRTVTLYTRPGCHLCDDARAALQRVGHPFEEVDIESDDELLRERAAGLGVPVKIPPPELCTDNAAMIGSAARFVEPVPFPGYLALDAYPTAA